jgi:hypothetical protein
MAVEAAVTREVERAFWRRDLPCGPDGSWFVDGLARYAATQSLASQYGGAGNAPSIGALEQRVAGGFVPFVLRATVPAWGDTVSAYRANARLDPMRARTASERKGLEAKTALAARTLSAWVGGPAWDAVLRSFVARSRGRCATWRDLEQSAADITGLDLSWFFEPAFGSGRVFDYGIGEFTSGSIPGTSGRYRADLTVRRLGDGEFTGTAIPPNGPFESGRGVEIVVRFADGSERADYWDGRAAARSFVFESATPAVAAIVDPRAIILLDLNRTNNSRSLAPRTAAAATRWSVIWSQWLEHLLLSYASLV